MCGQNEYTRYYTLARDSRELQLVRTIIKLMDDYTLARDSRELQLLPVQRKNTENYTLARDSRELQPVHLAGSADPDYTLARDSRELQLKKRSVACRFDFLSLSLILLIKK